jgi:hypothetical protein
MYHLGPIKLWPYTVYGMVRSPSQVPVLLPLGGQSQEDVMQHGFLGGMKGVCVGVSYRGRSMRLCAHRCGWRD